MTITCRYWIGSDDTGRICAAPADRANLCEKHYTIELRRTEKRVAKERASRAAAEAAWRARNTRNLPTWRATLERAEAEYARRTASPIEDRAAVSGHPAISRARANILSDSNVARVAELERIMRRLRTDITRAAAA